MRLIDADALIDSLGISDEDIYCESLIEEFPTADTVPVRHGKWIVYVISPFDGEDVKCSECGQHGCAPYWDYCPYCGSKNDEIINENDI